MRKGKRGVAVVPKDRARLMIGDGKIGLVEEETGDDPGLEEIELPYADGDNEEMEEISSSKCSFSRSTRLFPRSPLLLAPFPPLQVALKPYRPALEVRLLDLTP